MRRELVEKIVDEARAAEDNLIVWDRRDTFTVEPTAEITTGDDHMKVEMQNGKATVYVEYDSIYKLVIERERAARAGGAKAGFGSRLD